MCFAKRKTKTIAKFVHKFNVKDFVDFHHRDDIYFGTICDVYLNDENIVTYDIDIAGQCPTTYKGVEESRIIRIHK